MALVTSFLSAGAQNPQPEEQSISSDSLSATQEEGVQVAFRKVDQKDLLGGVSFVNVEELMKKNYTSYALDGMSGLVSGYNGTLWAMDGYLVLVDGIPRDAGNVMTSEVAQISFLKGASAVVLYGSRAAKGVIYITTKRGKTEGTRIDVRANTGFAVPVRYPKYLGSAEYMTLYNEARANDGLDPTYTDKDIFNHASGLNPYRYPDVNLYSSDYLKKAYNTSNATAEISGGSEKAQFYTNINLYNSGTLLKYGEADNDHITRFSVRGNIDVALGEYVKTYANANATFYDGIVATGDFWGAAATLRPNRVSPLIPTDYLMPDDENSWTLANNSANLIDGKYLLGGTQIDQTNALAALQAAGAYTYTERQYLFDMGIDIDLMKLLKGLSFRTQFAVDYSTTYAKYYENTYATYEPKWANLNGKDVIIGLTKYGEDRNNGVQNIAGSWTQQTISFSSQLNYKTKIADAHNLSAMLIAAGYQQGVTGLYHKPGNVNLGLQVDYDYLSKYYASLGSALVHSARLPEKNRNALSPSVTLGWRISKEGFLADSPVMDELLLTASGSILHTDLDITDYYLYQSTYNQSEGAWWGWADGNQSHATESRRGENSELSFIKRKEISLGLRGSLWKKLLAFDVSLFTNSMEGLLVQSGNIYPNYFYSSWPESTLIPYINYNSRSGKGFDFALNLNKKMGEVDLGLGVNGTYYANEHTRVDELYAEDYRYRKGRPSDGVWGLQTDGFFRNEADIAASPSSSFGEVKPGDLKYIDQNSDGTIDEKDEVYLGGRYNTPFLMGLNLTLKWKDFTFFALGTGYFGGTGLKSNDYYWISGDDKYSEVVRNRWTPETAETATYPRLTTLEDTHNFRPSDFWTYKADQFNLSKVQLTYDLPQSLFRNSFVRNLSVYAYAANVLTIAKERKILETNVGSSPQVRLYNIGFKIGF
jgi:TonB-linked SusC/RagA family outer membrane protein